MSAIIHLFDDHISSLIASPTRHLPSLFYLGPRLHSVITDDVLCAIHAPVRQATLDEPVPLTLLPEHGQGAFTALGLSGHRAGRDWSTQFTLTRTDQTAQSVTFYLEDSIACLSLTLSLTLAHGILTLQHQVTNTGDTPFELQRLALTLPLPAECSEILSFHGAWAKEFQMKRHRLEEGAFVVENRRGRTSHDRPPYICVGEPGFTETRGHVIGAHFAWSGSADYRVERLSSGRALLQFAELFFPGECVLASKAAYQTPPLYVAYSNTGLSGVTEAFHALTRRLCPMTKPRPVHFNSWEAVYFTHEFPTLCSLIDAAANVGVERFILDDGWFRHRDGDRAGLGDWFVDEKKYPQGLTPLVDYTHKKGMEFGLWFEPEMVSPDSDLYRAHPDWVLQVDGYQQRLGRYQYVIDLSNPDAWQYIYDCIDVLLSRYRIDYIKWDMNRDLVQAAHDGRASGHNQVLALYRLLAALRKKHPHVEIESCASGGGRIDLGILQYTSRVWLSDCNDPLERQYSQRGASVFLPPEVIGSHIGPSPAHTSLRSHSLGFRALTSLFAHMGIEWDITQLTTEECVELKRYLDLYKQFRALIHHGHSVRFDYCDSAYAYGVIAVNKHEALINIAQLTMPIAEFNPWLKLPGLLPNAMYTVRIVEATHPMGGQLVKYKPSWCDRSIKLTGECLAAVGLQLPTLYPESIVLLHLEAEPPQM